MKIFQTPQLFKCAVGAPKFIKPLKFKKMEPILGQGYGYGFALGLGAAFALLMVFITKVLAKYLGQVQNSERFSTASRSVRSGLIASSTVSAWTWPATLLTSGEWSYSHGISGGFLVCIFFSKTLMIILTSSSMELVVHFKLPCFCF